MKYPSEIYTPSSRIYEGLPDVSYPFHEREVTITTCGRICINNQKINVSKVLAGHNVGIREVEDKIWLVSFMQFDIGYFDEETRRIEPACNPFK